LAFAVVRPRQWPEAVAAVPAAVVVVAVGAVSPAEAWSQTRDLLPVVGFLAAVLVLAQLCADDGLFTAAGDAVAQLCAGRQSRLLAGVFAMAALVTAVLSLDATVVMLTPVVFATAARLGARPRPHVYATAHLANSASLLLPVSNLTNLVAFTASGLTFARFAVLMAPGWFLVILIEYVVFRRFFASDLGADRLGGEAPSPGGRRLTVPRFTLVVLGWTLVGFAATSLVGANPALAALAGALVLATRALLRRRTGLRELVAASSPLFCLFVLALGVVVKAVVDNGLAAGLGQLLPQDSSLPRSPGSSVAVAPTATRRDSSRRWRRPARPTSSTPRPDDWADPAHTSCSAAASSTRWCVRPREPTSSSAPATATAVTSARTASGPPPGS
jgi:arsenical pump membrane protein